MAKPLLKWAGGKRQLLHELVTRLPPSMGDYWEPFAGGAALFFRISCNPGTQKFTLADVNPVLCQLYNTVKEKPMDVIEHISSMGYGNNQRDYYSARSAFNNLNGKSSPVETSALLLYLNRHCYNGLYRVNSKGEFNVPFGSYISPKMPDREHIMAASASLERAEIRNTDFQDALSRAHSGDFAYLDPPYEPVSSSSSFTAYSKGGFTRDDQLRLAAALKDLDRRGINFMLSNSGNSELEPLYSSFNVIPIEARRNINSLGEKRGKVKEILVTNY